MGMEMNMVENNMYELVNIKRRNYYILITGVLLILIASGFCLLRDWTRRVEEPIMLPVCMEVGVDKSDWDESTGEVHIQLYYLTDNRFDDSVIGITFPKRPDLMSSGSESSNQFFYSNDSLYGNESMNVYRQYGRYDIHQINVDISSIPLEKEIKLTKAELLWLSGERTMVDIGTVYLYKNDYEQNTLISQYSSSGTDGLSVLGMEVTEDITVESIESPLFFYFDGKCTFHINGNMYQVSELNNLDLEFKKGDYLEIRVSTQGIRNQEFNPYYFIEIQPKILFKEKNGKQAYVRIYNIRESLDYKLTSENQIYDYIIDSYETH